MEWSYLAAFPLALRCCVRVRWQASRMCSNNVLSGSFCHVFSTAFFVRVYDAVRLPCALLLVACSVVVVVVRYHWKHSHLHQFSEPYTVAHQRPYTCTPAQRLDHAALRNHHIVIPAGIAYARARDHSFVLLTDWMRCAQKCK